MADLTWWGVCTECGAEPHAPDPEDSDFNLHRLDCSAGPFVCVRCQEGRHGRCIGGIRLFCGCADKDHGVAQEPS